MTPALDRSSQSLVSGGLTNEQVQERRDRGLVNDVEQRSSRTTRDILHANVFTRFNAIVTSLLVVIFVFGDPIDAMFGFVMICNSTIGVVQEIRAKRSLESVQLLIVPEVHVVREGEIEIVAPDELVLDDVIKIGAGDQVPVDALVLSSVGLEVDESALTGESEPVPKDVSDTVLSGSLVVEGSAVARAIRVGRDSWVSRLTREAQSFALTQSELRVGIDRLLTVVGWLLVPLATILVFSQVRSNAELADGLVSAVAGIVALVPQGLVLLVSMAFAVAVIRLAKQGVVVQELAAVEGLARIDVLCVDKTGTLTTGHLELEDLIAFGVDRSELEQAVFALSHLDAARNATVDALRDAAFAGEEWESTALVPFSSVRKWAAAEFGRSGAFYLGAPEILLEAAVSAERKPIEQSLAELAARSRRVLLVGRAAHLNGEMLPESLEPLGLVVLKEELRPDAANTMEYFARQGVQVIVISGDNPRTVGAVAKELGIPGAGKTVDLRNVDDLDAIAPDLVVFGRVLPEQKRDLVRTFQRQGRVVAMTGDGVNDIPALKAADIGIAMDTATVATKSIAQLVLLDGRFDRLPGVVQEGRRVVANMERVSALFITKTIYAALLILAVGAAGLPFPFLPRHLSLIATFTIGVPAFILSFRWAEAPAKPGYLRRVLVIAVPSGVFAATATFVTYWVARSDWSDASLSESRTLATIALTAAGLAVLHRLMRPLSAADASLLFAMALLFGMNVVVEPLSAFYALRLPDVQTLSAPLLVLGVSLFVYELTTRWQSAQS
ncbi:MAG: HAD-IC family P-type ATPase [Acidimicrobiia bacterium]|nr:HAD-IC family P-type ATPase [Acidimicrobiia bacterium]